MADRPFATIDEALEDIRAGRMVIVCDDEDRENEGDLTMAAEKVTPADIAFMATHGRGLICVPLTEERCDELQLRQMVSNNTALLGTAPAGKLLYSSDEASEPEVIWIAARLGRRALERALGDAVDRDFLTTPEAERLGRWILSENCRRLHGISA